MVIRQYWVMTFGPAQLMVLYSENPMGIHGSFTARPEQSKYGSRSSTHYSASRTLPIVRGLVKQGKLHFVAHNPF